MSTLKLVVWLIFLASCLIDRESLLAQEKAEGRSSAYRWEKDLPYRSVADPTGHPDRAYMAERCKLDLYLPADKKGFSTIVWFHGGGLTKGNKEIPAALKEKGIASLHRTTGSVRELRHPRISKMRQLRLRGHFRTSNDSVEIESRSL